MYINEHTTKSLGINEDEESTIKVIHVFEFKSPAKRSVKNLIKEYYHQLNYASYVLYNILSNHGFIYGKHYIIKLHFLAVKFLISDSDNIKFNPCKHYWNKIKLNTIDNPFQINILPNEDDIIQNIHTNVCDDGFENLIKFITDTNFWKKSNYYIKSYVQNYSYEIFEPDFRLFSFYTNKVTDFIQHVNQVDNFIDSIIN